MTKLFAIPMSIKEARVFVDNFHRHNDGNVGPVKFAVGVSDGNGLQGVAIAGRPIARHMDDGFTLEVRRTCVLDTAQKGANSFLYGCCWRAAKALGYRRLITYTLETESGASLRGAGWKTVAEVGANTWNHNGRARRWQPVYGQLKLRWEKTTASRPPLPAAAGEE